MKTVLYGFFILILISCSNEFLHSEKPTLKEDKFLKVYEEILIVENYYQMKYGNPKTVENALNKSCQKIFAKHRVLRKDFEESFEYYANHPQILKSINEKIISRLNKKKIQLD
jgi:hypothetical protein